jgi:hypothetical protein
MRPTDSEQRRGMIARACPTPLATSDSGAHKNWPQFCRAGYCSATFKLTARS